MRLASPSRRSFLKTAAIGATTVYIAPLGSKAYAALFEEQLLTPVEWNPASGHARFRIDAIAKVTGSKIFARDIRSRDLPNWPREQSHALILRTTLADRVYAGLDLAILEPDLRPDRLVAVLVSEAMKMESEIQAAIDGTVKA